MEVSTDNKGIRIVRQEKRRLLTGLAIGFSTIEESILFGKGENLHGKGIVSLLKEIVKKIKEGNAEKVKLYLEVLRDKIMEAEKRNAVWFVMGMLKAIVKGIEGFMDNQEVWENEDAREKMANRIELIAGRLEGMARISKEVAEKLLRPIDLENIEEDQAERLAALLELYLSEIGLAPEFETKKRGRTILERVAEKIVELWRTNLAKVKEKLIGIIAMITVGSAWLGKTTGTSTAMSIALWLTFGPMAPIASALCKRIAKKIGEGERQNLMNNLVNGLIVAIMTILGMVSMNLILVATAPKKKVEVWGEEIEIPMLWESPVRNIVTFKTEAIIWIMAATAIVAVASGILGKLRNPERLVEELKGDANPNEPEPRVKGMIMKIGLIVAMVMGIVTYMKIWDIGLFDKMPSGVLLSAIAWTWDELDDLGDGVERIEMWRIKRKTGLKPKVEDEGVAEIIILPLILGAFATLFGITDPMQVIIPGSSGFLDYVVDNALPEPWNIIVGSLIKIVFFVVGMLIACGSAGLGAVMYIVGSVMGQIIVERIISAFVAI